MTHDLRTMARALGGEVAGRDTVLAPGPGHSPKDRSLSVTLSPGAPDGFVVHSHASDDWQDCRDYVRERLGMPQWQPGAGRERRIYPSRAPRRDAQTIDREIEKTEEARQKLARARAIWNEARDPRGTLAEKYLNGRGLELDEDLCGRVLRFHPRCPFGERTSVPALVVAFQPIRSTDDDAPPQAIHRIGLTPDGRKIEKKMLGPASGCAIKLDADDMVELGLGICEGLETGLAVRATGWRPIWVLGSASVFRTLTPIPGIEALTIFADHDVTGLGAAQVCAERWQAAGCEAFIRWPKGLGRDYADEAGR